jgi:hypothetical protein
MDKPKGQGIGHAEGSGRTVSAVRLGLLPPGV